MDNVEHCGARSGDARRVERQAGESIRPIVELSTAKCVSPLSASGMGLEHISRLVGHNGTIVTETVYRHQIRPMMQEGATAMDRIFPSEREQDRE